jgi:poly-gamma-glutamate capsule biosynthesis protein CapA/YwtB (metallophosphatase superfamily)
LGPPRRRYAAALFALGLSLAACGGAHTPTPTATPPPDPSASPSPTSTATGAIPSATPRGVTLAAIGDVMLDRDVETFIADQGDAYPWARVSHLFEGADLVLANLEGTLTSRGVATDKLYTFRTEPALASTLSAAGIDIVSLANNHTTDFGEPGLEDTIATLDALGIGHFGAGGDEATAHAPLVRNVEGNSVAFLGYADIGGTRFAEDGGIGVAFADPEAMRLEVAEAAATHDFVVVTLHSGIEYSDGPSLHQRDLAHAAVDAGADLVVGHHPHVLQGWERFGDALILYSLGNFVFDLDADDLATLGPVPFLTAVVLVELRPGAAPRLEVRPAFIDPVENRPRPATVEEAEAVRSRLSALPVE